MKNIFKFAASALVLTAFATESNAQATASATASATIVTPISILKTANMNFGNIAVGQTAGTVILTPSNGRSTTGGVTLPATQGSVASAAFTVSGESGYTYAITLPSTTVTLASGANTMPATSFTSIPTPTGILTGGSQTLTVGATLGVSANQASGTYTTATPFDVTVNYN